MDDEDADAAAVNAPGGTEGPSWRRIDASGDLGGSGWRDMNDVAANGELLVAVGWEESDAAVWTSSDGGETWTQTSDSPELTGDGQQEMHAVAAWDGGFVAVGQEYSSDFHRAVSWSSPDGLTWRRIDLPAPDFSQLWTVRAWRGGLIAAGNGIWLSSDGQDWEYVGWTGDLIKEGASIEVLLEFDGILLAFVADYEGDGADAGLWRSSDGRSWTRVGAPGAFGNGVVFTDATLWSGGIAASTWEEVWTSTDGVNWTAGRASVGSATVNSIAAAGGGLVAVGGTFSDAAAWMWTGSEWISSESGDAQLGGGEDLIVMNGVTIWDDRVAVAVGRDTSRAPDFDAAVWLAEIGPTMSDTD